MADIANPMLMTNPESRRAYRSCRTIEAEQTSAPCRPRHTSSGSNAPGPLDILSI